VSTNKNPKPAKKNPNTILNKHLKNCNNMEEAVFILNHANVEWSRGGGCDGWGSWMPMERGGDRESDVGVGESAQGVGESRT
jgi:hypothetical protein